MTTFVKTAATLGSLSSSSRYKNHLESVRNALASSDGTNSAIDQGALAESNTLLQDIDQEIFHTFRFVSEAYHDRFPELESLVPNRIDYIRAVHRIGNEMDMSLINLTDILTQKQIMVISVSASTTPGVPLSSDRLSCVIRACEDILKLEEDKAVLLQYLEASMSRLAPNLCALLGSQVTARLISLVGGLDALVKIPACNLQILGQEKRQLMGLSGHSTLAHAGIIAQCDLVQQAPPDLKKKVVKTLAAKAALAARIDLSKTNSVLPTNLLLAKAAAAAATASTNASSTDSGVVLHASDVPDGIDDGNGERLRAQVVEKLEKLQEPNKARTKKALPAPEEKKKARRGGRRMRKLKERLALTDVAKAANRVTFNPDVGEYGDSAMGVDILSAGIKDSQKLRAPRKSESQFLKKAKRAVSASSGQTSGLSSSLVFTPVQGLELVDPNAAKQRVMEANQKWFAANSGFLSAKPKAN